MATTMQLTPLIPKLRRGQPQNLNFHNKPATFTCCSVRNSELLVSQFNPKIPVEEAVTPPTSWYTDPSFFQLELDRVFYRGWQAVGQFYSPRSFNLYPLFLLSFFYSLLGIFLFCFPFPAEFNTEENEVKMMNFNPI